MDMPQREPSHLEQTLRRIAQEQFDGNMSKVARKIGVSPSTVKRWIDDGMAPKSDTVSLICRKLQITPTDLLGDEAPASQRRGVVSAPINNEDQAAAVDWLILKGEEADAVAMAASIVARRVKDGKRHPRLWWVAQMSEVLHELG